MIDQPERRKTMPSPTAALRSRRGLALAAACGAILVALPAGRAAAGEFEVASCQADQLNFSTTAFNDFATRGMKIKRACNPEGPGLRGVITSNTIQPGQVSRGSVAMVTINAPAGTRFTSFRWAGSAQRRDCSYALQLYADAPDVKPIPIKNVRANQNCPKPSRAQAAGYRARTFDVNGATRIVQRVICVGTPDRQSCPSRDANYIRTYKAQVGIADGQPPSVTILGDTPLAQGAWVSGVQPLNYDASDVVGVRMAQAVVAGITGGSHQRACDLASPDGAFAVESPCPNGPGQIAVDTKTLPEGSQQLVVQGEDAAGNLASSGAITAHIDNTPPGRVDATADGGEQWRNQNNFGVSWVSAPEVDRAPVVAANYKLCPASGGGCVQGEQDGADISHFGIQVPAPGEWTLSLWRRDAAGNQIEDAASVPVTFRYDPEPPQVAFEQTAADDPTKISVLATDTISGLADGSIEISRAGTDTWQGLPTDHDATHFTTRIDDTALPPGDYVLRATAHDQAGNESSTTQRIDGQPMAITLPLRITSAMRAGVAIEKTVHRTVRRHGKRHRVRRRVTTVAPRARVAFGKTLQVTGQLANRDGQGIAGAEIQVFSSSPTTPQQLVAVLNTDGNGRYTYAATATTSRTLHFSYAGSALVLPAASDVQVLVPAVSTLHVSRTHVLNGQAVTFGGRTRTLPVPAGGKLIQLEVWLSRRWQTFRTVRTDAAGRWAIRYRFKRTAGVQRFRFRAELPGEADYPYEPGNSKSIHVRVRGR
jgi:hypothetical protein